MAILRDVGREAGVACSTASVVLSGGRLAEQIPAATQERIRDAALKLKYRPNAGGRQLRHNRTKTIALFLSAESDRSSLAPELLYAINDELLKHEYALNFVRLDDLSLSNPAFTPRFLRQKEVDGVLVNYNVHMPQRFVDLIHYYEMPAAFLNIKRPNNAVYFDHERAARQVIERLAALGHRRIYLVNFSGRFPHHSIEDTQAGYQAVMQAHGLTPVVLDERIEHADRCKVGIDLLESRVQGLPAPTAILAMGITTAIPLLQSASHVRRRIPEQLSLVTIDGTRLPDILTPPLSHIFVPWDKAGRTGVQMLLNLLDSGTHKPVEGCVECEWSKSGGTVAAVGEVDK